MNQIALPLFAQDTRSACAAASLGESQGPDAKAAFDAVGFEIGWDFAHHRLTPPADHLHGQHPVRQGWEAGRAAFGARTLKPTRHVRRWLQLRLTAWMQGLPYEGLMLTPRYLALIEPLQCPVTREVLTHDTGADTDAVVVRLNPGAAFAPGHLALLSRRVAQALGSADVEAVRAMAQQASGPDPATPGGLDDRQWGRLASLMSLAVQQPHERIAAAPMRVLPPNRLRLLNPVQALQALMTHLFLGDGYARRMTVVASLMPNADARRSYFLFMNAMLARRLAAGWAADRNRLRMALEDAWAHPVIERRWEQLALRLRRADCERIVRLAAQRGLLGASVRWLDDDAATEGWAFQPGVSQGTRRPQLPSVGAVRSLSADEDAAVAAASDGVAWRRWQRAHLQQSVEMGTPCTA
jgi:hypothetical protein